jgi:protein-S-isoprenylcysteine O-methyltransferase Ste14/pimeloyl-ACP methyl ester carboxylesterase
MNTEKAFNAIFWTLLGLMLLMRVWFAFQVWRTGERIRADREARRREGFWAHAVAYLFLLLLVALAADFLFRGGSLRRFAFPTPGWLRWAGVGLGIASLGLFVWTHVVLGRFWSPYVQLRPGHRVITAGPYARLRHPMYCAIVGWMTSLGLVAANWIPLACAALGTLQFFLRIRGEQKMMLQEFGDEYREYMKRTGQGRIVAAAIAALILGAILSRAIEPGVRVEKLMLTADTPALRIFPSTRGPHPVALLAHGNGGSKEMFFRFGEALAAAGFDCYSVDQAGYGESPRSCSRTNVRQYFVEAERALGAVDVFVGHSMGGGTGTWSVRKGGFRPRVFIGVGYPADLGEHGPPTLLLAGLFEEFFRPAELRAVTNAQVVISPWCEHILEVYDPVLVNAGVRAACATVGKPAPDAPTAWLWRFAGLVLGIAGALVLMFRLPELHPRLALARRLIVPGILLLALFLTLGPWVGVNPQLRRIPQQLVLLPVICLALAGLGRLRLPRWSLAGVTGILALACLAVAHHLAFPQFEKSFFLTYTLFCALGLSTLLLLPSALVGRIATRGGSRRDGDVAMAIFASYCIGQFMPLFY